MSTEDMELEDATLIALLDGALPEKDQALLERRLAAQDRRVDPRDRLRRRRRPRAPDRAD